MADYNALLQKSATPITGVINSLILTERHAKIPRVVALSQGDVITAVVGSGPCSQAHNACVTASSPAVHELQAVASLGLLSPGAANDGVTPSFSRKN